MAYNGFLIKLNNDYIVPPELITESTYKGKYSTNDADSYRDGYGDLHREALAKKKFKAEFTTPPITNKTWNLFYTEVRNRFVNEVEKKIMCTVYIEELDDYKSGYAYIPDITFTITRIDNKEKLVYYEPIRIAFIEY